MKSMDFPKMNQLQAPPLSLLEGSGR